jgi:mRNA interferase HigB
MKMGTIASPWRYDDAARDALRSVNLRRPAILRYAAWAVARRVRARLASNPVVTRMVTRYDLNMQVIARRTLREFWAHYPHAEDPIRAWVAVAAKARWANPAEIKRQFGSTVDLVGDNRVIFDLGGNKYRLVVHV